MMSNKDIAWVAGFLEGEGTFGFYRLSRTSKYWYLSVSADQVNPEPLEKLRAFFGENVRGPYKRKRGRAKPIFQWSAHGSVASGIMMTLFSLMSGKRKLQIKTALAGWRKYLGR